MRAAGSIWTSISIGLVVVASAPAGLDKDKLEGAKAGLASLNQSWTEASGAAKSGNMSDAIAKGQAAKAKAVEVMTALNMQVPEAAK